MDIIICPHDEWAFALVRRSELHVVAENSCRTTPLPAGCSWQEDSLERACSPLSQLPSVLRCRAVPPAH